MKTTPLSLAKLRGLNDAMLSHILYLTETQGWNAARKWVHLFAFAQSASAIQKRFDEDFEKENLSDK
jgi:hypothetical protein